MLYWSYWCWFHCFYIQRFVALYLVITLFAMLVSFMIISFIYSCISLSVQWVCTMMSLVSLELLWVGFLVQDKDMGHLWLIRGRGDLSLICYLFFDSFCDCLCVYRPWCFFYYSGCFICLFDTLLPRDVVYCEKLLSGSIHCLNRAGTLTSLNTL